MEELQSTDILDREILEDARKKALRILKTADDTIAAKTAEWDKKTTEAINTLEKKYKEQTALASEKIMARLPVDKLRAKTEKIECFLQDAVEDWYKSISRQKILDLLKNELDKRMVLCSFPPTAKKRVYYSGLEQKEAQSIINFSDGSVVFEQVPSACDYPSITLETETVHIVVSIQKIIDFYLAEKREELVETLVGRDFMESA